MGLDEKGRVTFSVNAGKEGMILMQNLNKLSTAEAKLDAIIKKHAELVSGPPSQPRSIANKYSRNKNKLDKEHFKRRRPFDFLCLSD